MIGRILVFLFAFLLVALAIVWALGGGPSRALSSARGVSNPLELFMGKDSGGAPIALPWQIPATAGPGISFDGTDAPSYASPEDGDGGAYPGYGYDSREEQVPHAQARDFGDPSPYIGRVSFAAGVNASHETATEFLTLAASPAAEAPVAISGWMLQSMISGRRVIIPQAAPLYVSGTVNAVDRARLSPGDFAVIASGPSPVGVSFRENACSGYLAQFQSFTPPLDTGSCPGPASVPAACTDYAQRIPACRFPGRDEAPGVSPACRSWAADTLSYNGCVNAYRGTSGFARPSWRIYLASGAPLWRTHDTIRLLDERGRVVDVISY